MERVVQLGQRENWRMEEVYVTWWYWTRVTHSPQNSHSLKLWWLNISIWAGRTLSVGSLYYKFNNFYKENKILYFYLLLYLFYITSVSLVSFNYFTRIFFLIYIYKWLFLFFTKTILSFLYLYINILVTIFTKLS